MWISEQLAIKKMFREHSHFNREHDAHWWHGRSKSSLLAKKKNGHHPGGGDTRVEGTTLCLTASNSGTT
jgi:hypothetical protein